MSDDSPLIDFYPYRARFKTYERLAPDGRDRQSILDELATMAHEEDRILYVAMTRAKDELDLIVPLRFFDRSQAKSGNGHMYASVSRFVPESIRKYFDCRGWRERRDDGVTERKKSSPVDLSAKLMRKWR